jgi:hypothetical protein
MAPSGPVVKQTTANILREDALLRKQQEQKTEQLKQFELLLRDASDFEQ